MTIGASLALDLVTWAVRSVAFFNLVALLWLGLTVLLNTEQRRWGAWVAGGALVLGGLFFAAHVVVVERALVAGAAELELWWRIGWAPFVVAPYLWYVVIAWYTGVLAAGPHRLWLGLLSAWGLAGLALLAWSAPLPSYTALLATTPRPTGELAPALALYPLFSLVCVGLSLAALRRPASTERFMGDLARRRARPWLVACAALLLLIALVVGAVAAWLLLIAPAPSLGLYDPVALAALLGVDLLVIALVALVVVCLGQAIVAYEVFAGTTLPRGGLARHWRASLALAGGFGLLMGLSLTLPVDAIYRVLLATLLLAGFAGLFSWRAYGERERGIRDLRPFVASEHLYEHLLRPAEPPPVDAAAPLRALCDRVLGARLVRLQALGPLAPLVGPPLAYPPGATARADDGALAGLTGPLRSPGTLCVPLDPAAHGGAVWAVPLWSERGLIGVLLLGEKRTGGLYTREEMEIARAAGERLIDTRASAELARRLMAVQRQRLAESQLLDRQARRVLHDEVLPQLHAALLSLGGRAEPAVAEAVTHLAGVHRQIADLLRAMPAGVTPGVARLGLLGALRQMIAGDLGGAFDHVTWQVEPDAAEAAGALPPLAAEVVFAAVREAVRNAARHGRGGQTAVPLHLTLIAAWRAGLEVRVEDDGVGLGEPGRAGGSGQGLALHGAMLAIVGGTLTVEGGPDGGTRVTIAMGDEWKAKSRE